MSRYINYLQKADLFDLLPELLGSYSSSLDVP